MKLHYLIKYPNRNRHYRTLDGAVTAAFRFLRAQQKEPESRRVAYLEVRNGGVVCRLMATPDEICITYVKDKK
jgi:hypothetical protein